MNTYRITLEVKLEIDAFNVSDAKDLAAETIREMEGLGVTVIDVTVTGETEI